MNDEMIFEKNLKKAAAQVRDAMLDEAMVMESEEHIFSPEFEKHMQQTLPVKQRKKVPPAVIAMPIAAALALVVGLSCWMVGTGGNRPAQPGNSATDQEQTIGSSLLIPEDPQAVSYQFQVDGLVGSVVLAQPADAGTMIEVSGKSGTNALGIASMWSEGVQ